jgi:hypothetical protein
MNNWVYLISANRGALIDQIFGSTEYAARFS